MIALTLFASAATMLSFYQYNQLITLKNTQQRLQALNIATSFISTLNATGRLPKERTVVQGEYIIAWKAQPFTIQSAYKVEHIKKIHVTVSWQQRVGTTKTCNITTAVRI